MSQAFQSHIVPQFNASRERFGFQSRNPDEWSILLSFEIPVGTSLQPFSQKRIGIPDRDGDNRNTMQIAPEITFEGCEPSPAAREAILKEIERLETHNQRITGCRVSVIAPSVKHRHGPGFQVNIWLTIPPHENIVVNHAATDDPRHEYAKAAIKDAFATARRQIDDLSAQ